MTDVTMPQMGESIAEGTITKWMKNVGDTVKRDEPLFEISTDKVDAEIPSPAAGVLKEIRFPTGAVVPIHTVVAVIAGEGDTATKPQQTAPPPVPAPTASPPPATSASAPAPSPQPPPADETRAPAPPSSKPRSEMTVDELRQTRSSPVVRKIAAEHNVDLREIHGTGIAGRVTKLDILGHLGERPDETTATPEMTPAQPSPAPERPQTPASPPTSTDSSRPAFGTDRTQAVPMSPIRKKTAEHMLLSKRTSAHVTTVFEIDMSRVALLRAKYRRTYEERSGIKLTYMPFILKATVDALKAFSILNASMEGESVLYHQDVNIGIAVALDWGLIVPVLRRADEKNVLGLARAVNDLAERARSKQLKVDEVQGGTFTITNPGVFGSLFGTPIIHQPQVAILSVGTIEKRPVVRDDAIAIRTMAYFALSFDHRIVDGADADRFMAHIKGGLQEFDESAL